MADYSYLRYDCERKGRKTSLDRPQCSDTAREIAGWSTPTPPHPTTPNVLGLVHQQSDPNESQTAIELLISTAIFPIPSELSDSNTGLPKESLTNS